MRIVKYTDKKGYIRSVKVKDEDPDSMAKYGVPVDFPDLDALDWDGLKRDLHNVLMESGYYTLSDVMKSGQAFAPAMTVLKRYLTECYTLDSSSGG